MAFVKLYVKKEPQFGKLNLSQQQMAKIGAVGVGSVINRARDARNATDQPAKPLTRRYAIRKSKLRRSQKITEFVGGGLKITNKRDLTLTGDMLRNLSVRSVSENAARAGWTTLKNRQKARNNERLEHWIDFSPKNTADTINAASLALKEQAGRLIKVRYK